jgi:hypothetical protein
MTSFSNEGDTARRYAERFAEAVNAGREGEPVKVWRDAFRRAFEEDGRIGRRLRHSVDSGLGRWRDSVKWRG